MPTLDITLLGRFAVPSTGAPVDRGHWTRRHAAGLVKVLALAPGRRLHREQVLDLLWPEEPIEQVGARSCTRRRTSPVGPSACPAPSLLRGGSGACSARTPR